MTKSCLPRRRPPLQQGELRALNKERARQRSEGPQIREQGREAKILLTAI